MAKDEDFTPADVHNSGKGTRGRKKQSPKDKAIANFRDSLIVRALLICRHFTGEIKLEDGEVISGASGTAKMLGITNPAEASKTNAEFRGFYNGLVADYQKRIEMRKIRKVADARGDMAKYITPEELEAFGLEEFQDEEGDEPEEKRA